ncbi:unnamed protein product [Cunninghamella blakesleeana]
MFVPTIKYKRVDIVKEQPTPVIILDQPTSTKKVPEKAIATAQLQQLSIKKTDTNTDNTNTTKEEEKEEEKDKKVKEKDLEVIDNKTNKNTVIFEETEQPTIVVDPKDNERILVTLTDGTQYTTDRYCPHAGADLSYLGQVEEDEYPPEIGPILLCTLHYWEYALKRGGRGANGVATINACPIKNDEQCQAKKELDW